MGLADSYYGMILDCDLPNSCFRSGNSLGRVSMIDGCLSHMINDQVRHFDLSIKKSYHVLSAASSGALRSWDPGEAWAWIPYLHFIATPPWSSPPQYLHSRVTSDWQTHFKLFCYLTFCHMFFSLANTLYIGVCLLSTDHVKQCLFWCLQQMMSHSLEILFHGDVR